MSLPRALPAARAYVALELALDGGLTVGEAGEDDPAVVFDRLLDTLGVPALVGGDRRLDLAVEAVELATRYRQLETGGTYALGDDVPPGVSITRVLDAELERLYGQVTSLVERLARELRA